MCTRKVTPHQSYRVLCAHRTFSSLAVWESKSCLSVGWWSQPSVCLVNSTMVKCATKTATELVPSTTFSIERACAVDHTFHRTTTNESCRSCRSIWATMVCFGEALHILIHKGDEKGGTLQWVGLVVGSVSERQLFRCVQSRKCFGNKIVTDTSTHNFWVYPHFLEGKTIGGRGINSICYGLETTNDGSQWLFECAVRTTTTDYLLWYHWCRRREFLVEKGSP
jgi:hypothetical protein